MEFNNLHITFYFFLFLSSFNLSAQTSFKVTYFVSEIKTQGSIENLDNDTKLLFMQMVDFTMNVKYILVTSADESYFESKKVLTKGDDSPLTDILVASAERFTSFNEKVHTNHKEDSIIFARNITNQDFIVKRSAFNFDWKPKKDTKEILGYKARKAEGKYLHPVLNKELKVEAWYCPDIPLPYGPNEFNGLPGLILELKDSHFTFYVKEINLGVNQDIRPLSSDDILSEEEFNEKKYRN